VGITATKHDKGTDLQGHAVLTFNHDIKEIVKPVQLCDPETCHRRVLRVVVWSNPTGTTPHPRNIAPETLYEEARKNPLIAA